MSINKITEVLKPSEYDKKINEIIEGKADLDLLNTEPDAGFAALLAAAGIHTVTDSYFNAGTGSFYIIFSNGLCIQGGQAASGSNGFVYISFLRPVTAGLTASASIYGNTSGGDFSCLLEESNAGMNIRTFYNGLMTGPMGLRWLEIGIVSI